MLDKINKEVVAAMKAGDKFRLNVIKLLKSEIQADAKSANPRSVEQVIAAHRKRLGKTLDLYKDRPEQLAELKKELDILDEFMPKAMSEDEVIALIDKHMELGNFGQVMKAVRGELTGPFDGKKLAEMIKAKFA